MTASEQTTEAQRLRRALLAFQASQALFLQVHRQAEVLRSSGEDELMTSLGPWGLMALTFAIGTGTVVDFPA